MRVETDVELQSAVENELNFVGRSDVEIARAVRAALARFAAPTEPGIRSTVSRGCVTLMGAVMNRRQRDEVERAVWRLCGVTNVTNEIEVRSPTVSSAELRKCIQDALARKVERESRHLQIDVKGGHVFLRGVVHSPRECEAVLGAVKGMPGVSSVDHELRVDPFAV